MRAITLTPAERRVMRDIIDLAHDGPVTYPPNPPRSEERALRDLLALGLLDDEHVLGGSCDVLVPTDLGLRILEDQAVAA